MALIFTRPFFLDHAGYSSHYSGPDRQTAAPEMAARPVNPFYYSCTYSDNHFYTGRKPCQR